MSETHSIPRTMFERTVQRTNAARERMAERLFNWEEIKKQINERASKGWTFLRLEPSMPFDLENTAAARGIELKLEKHNYKATWINAAWEPQHQKNKEGEEIKYKILRITWDEEAVW